MKKQKLSVETKKVFEVKLATYYIGKDESEYYENGNRVSLNVVATDVFDALAVVGEWILEEEKKAKKEEEGVYVESVNLIANIDLF
jgi:hypothetical protein